MTTKQFDPSESLIFLTNRVGRLLGNDIRCRARLKNIGLSPSHMGVLVDLWVKDGLRQQELAVSSIKDKATIARALDSLEKENLVVRITDERDKRNKRIYLTHKGKELQMVMIPHAQATLQEATADISEEDLQTCRMVLKKMYNKLNK